MGLVEETAALHLLPSEDCLNKALNTNLGPPSARCTKTDSGLKERGVKEGSTNESASRHWTHTGSPNKSRAGQGVKQHDTHIHTDVNYELIYTKQLQFSNNKEFVIALWLYLCKRVSGIYGMTQIERWFVAYPPLTDPWYWGMFDLSSAFTLLEAVDSWACSATMWAESARHPGAPQTRLRAPMSHTPTWCDQMCSYQRNHSTELCVHFIQWSVVRFSCLYYMYFCL